MRRLLWIGLACLVAGVLIGSGVSRLVFKGTTDTIDVSRVVKEFHDTTIKVDTMFFPVPTLYYVKADESRLAIVVNDTADTADDDTICLDTKVYQDSLYTAYVSGFYASLDSIRVYPRNYYIHDSIVVETTVTLMRKPKRWHIGPSVGFGVTGKGFQPYIGISASYSLISF